MTKSYDLSKCSREELIAELARRSEPLEDEPELELISRMELAVERVGVDVRAASIESMIARMKPEKPSAKPCPKCGKKVAVSQKDRPRTVRTLSGEVTFRRHYHYCKLCKEGFYPRDEMLGLAKEGEVTPELEKRIIDFAINEPFEKAAERWTMHYGFSVSSNLLRRVMDRFYELREQCEELVLQEEVKRPSGKRPGVLIVQIDGSMLPMRGAEPWKEAKLGVIYRPEHHLCHREAKRGHISEPRYVASIGTKEFVESMRCALRVEREGGARFVAWLGDGAVGNWKIAERLATRNKRLVQILDWYHAVENGMKCARRILGEESELLPIWKKRLEALLWKGDHDRLVHELMDCIVDASDEDLEAIDDLIRYYRNNEKRMRYQEFLARGFPIGNGIVESAHRHVLQNRMKLAGQHWSIERARHLVRLRAAYRTTGPANFYRAIRRAHRRSKWDRKEASFPTHIHELFELSA